ncbi:Hypothetical_protein [Hexamita inflata]|uniref:Hypothetical_protein n=1 Tax=Hexamita inflata TaxID=28002 RepID=A0AA86UK57_9EUKA|nr:Hypothetical protein HINF_LOCUS41957 [Hexamita inflata]
MIQQDEYIISKAGVSYTSTSTLSNSPLQINSLCGQQYVFERNELKQFSYCDNQILLSRENNFNLLFQYHPVLENELKQKMQVMQQGNKIFVFDNYIFISGAEQLQILSITNFNQVSQLKYNGKLHESDHVSYFTDNDILINVDDMQIILNSLSLILTVGFVVKIINIELNKFLVICEQKVYILQLIDKEPELITVYQGGVQTDLTIIETHFNCIHQDFDIKMLSPILSGSKLYYVNQNQICSAQLDNNVMQHAQSTQEKYRLDFVMYGDTPHYVLSKLFQIKQSPNSIPIPFLQYTGHKLISSLSINMNYQLQLTKQCLSLFKKGVEIQYLADLPSNFCKFINNRSHKQLQFTVNGQQYFFTDKNILVFQNESVDVFQNDLFEFDEVFDLRQLDVDIVQFIVKINEQYFIVINEFNSINNSWHQIQKQLLKYFNNICGAYFYNESILACTESKTLIFDLKSESNKEVDAYIYYQSKDQLLYAKQNQKSLLYSVLNQKQTIQVLEQPITDIVYADSVYIILFSKVFDLKRNLYIDLNTQITQYQVIKGQLICNYCLINEGLFPLQIQQNITHILDNIYCTHQNIYVINSFDLVQTLTLDLNQVYDKIIQLKRTTFGLFSKQNNILQLVECDFQKNAFNLKETVENVTKIFKNGFISNNKLQFGKFNVEIDNVVTISNTQNENIIAYDGKYIIYIVQGEIKAKIELEKQYKCKILLLNKENIYAICSRYGAIKYKINGNKLEMTHKTETENIFASAAEIEGENLKLYTKTRQIYVFDSEMKHIDTKKITNIIEDARM